MSDLLSIIRNNLTAFLYLFLVTMVLIWYWNRRHLYRYSHKVPGPKGWPLIGNVLEFTGGGKEIYDNTIKCLSTYPNLTKLWIGPMLVYGVTKPEYLEIIFTSEKTFSKPPSYEKISQSVLGHGLTTVPRSTWKRHRKIVMPVFNQKILNEFVQIFAKQCCVLSDRFEKKAGNKFDLLETLSRCTLDITCETLMGVQIDAQKKESLLFQWLDRLMEIMYLQLSTIWYQFDFIFRWTQLHKETQELKKEFDYFIEQLITEKNSTLSKSTTFSSRKTFLDLLLDSSSNDKLTVNDIRDEIKTFILAASDTTAVTACFTLVMLAMHPDIQNRVYNEALQILGTDGTVTYQHLSLFEYVPRVIKETLRLFPAGPLLTRQVKEDLPLEENLILPKGASLILCLIHVQRNGEFWSDPLKFDPDRFLPENAANIYPYSYVPFAAGMRHCVGKKYAMMSLTTMVATVIRKFRFYTEYKTVDEIKFKAHVVIRPRDGFKLTLELRK